MSRYIKLFISFFIISVNVQQFAQEREIEAFITAEVLKHPEHDYLDSIKVTLTLKNKTDEDIKIRLSNNYFAEFLSDEKSSYYHCFTFDELGNNRGRYSEEERTLESFVTIPAGGEYRDSGYFGIGWRCRSASPDGEWKFRISYNRVITAEDNYYNAKYHYSDKVVKEVVIGAWIGVIESNKVEIIVR